MLCREPDARSPAALASLYAEHHRFVARTLRRLGVRPADVDDLVHEVFIVVLRRLDEYEERDRIQAWLFGISLRVAAAHRRRSVRARLPQGAIDADDAGPSPDPEGAALARAQRSRLERLLSQMAPHRRAVLILFEVVELGCVEIARLLSIPVGTVYSRLHAARRELAQLAAPSRADA